MFSSLSTAILTFPCHCFNISRLVSSSVNPMSFIVWSCSAYFIFGSIAGLVLAVPVELAEVPAAPVPKLPNGGISLYLNLYLHSKNNKDIIK